MTCVLFIDNIEHIYSSNTSNLHVSFLLGSVIEKKSRLKLEMTYLWLKSLIQSIDFKSHKNWVYEIFSQYLLNDCVSMYKHMLLHIFQCIIKTLQNVKFIPMFTNPFVIRGNMAEDPLPSFWSPSLPQILPNSNMVS